MLLIIIVGLGLFAAMLALQVVTWRVFHVRREIAWLFVLYLLIPAVAGVSLCFAHVLQPMQGLAIGLLHFALAAAYIQTYPALRENIPSFRILLLIDRYSDTGLSAPDIVERLRNEGLFQAKIDDLVGDGLAVKTADGKLTATRSGAFLAGAFKIYRDLLGLKIGNG